MASINDSIGSNDPPTAATKRLIAEGLWGPQPAVKKYSNGESSEEINLDAYFRFYTTSCVRAVYDSGRYMLDQTHQQILNIAYHLREGDSRDSIQKSLSHLSPESVDKSINLAAQLLLMLKFTSPRYAISGTEQLSWTNDSAIADPIREYFLPKQETEDEVISLESSFTGYNIEKIAGIEIFWTDNLADHLRLMEDDTKVAIFHHVTFLECQSKSILPRGLAKETLKTISLLFPQGENKTRHKYGSSTNIDARLLRCGYLRSIERDINNFPFWRDRLVMLKQRFDDAHPKTINQWWWDRRNGVQWYTFWVAILILVLTTFFGLVQSIEGALQVYKAFVPGRT